MAKSSVEFLGYSDGSVEVLFIGSVPKTYRSQIMKSMTNRGMVERLEKRDRTCDMFYFDPSTGPVSRNRKIISKSTTEVNIEAPTKSLKKPSDWANHQVPKVDASHYKDPVRNEHAMAKQLADLLMNKSMLGVQPPRQPTDQEMFGHLVPTEDQLAKADQDWNNSFQAFFREASKPLPGGTDGWNISKETQEYWDSIKVNEDERED